MFAYLPLPVNPSVCPVVNTGHCYMPGIGAENTTSSLENTTSSLDLHELSAVKQQDATLDRVTYCTGTTDDIEQGCSTLVLRVHCPVCFRCFPAPAHLILMNGRHQGATELDNNPFIWIRCVWKGNWLRIQQNLICTNMIQCIHIFFKPSKLCT